MPLSDSQRIDRETDPPAIFLGPRCEVLADEGRLWCEDPQPCDDDNCPHKPVKYIRADLVETFSEVVAALQACEAAYDATGDQQAEAHQQARSVLAKLKS